MAKSKTGVALGLGMLLGAAGAVFFSKKTNREKVVKAITKIKDKSQKSNFLGKISDVLKDVETLNDQKNLDVKSKKK